MTRATVVDTHAHYWRPPTTATFQTAPTDVPIEPGAFAALMDLAGVSRLLQVTRFFDENDDYSLAGVAAHPDRFRVLGKYDESLLKDPASLSSWSKRFGIVGLRVFTHPTDESLFSAGAIDFWRTIESIRLPVSVYAPGYLADIRALAASFPGIPIVLDHAGLTVFERTPPERRFDEWDEMIAMAELPNVFAKASALPEATLESFPYPHAQDRLRSIVEAYGADRVMWGSNFTPAASVGSYEQLAEFARLGVAPLPESDRREVLSGTAGRVFGIAGWIDESARPDPL